ncbi:hypothetical protein [Azospirillum cavernae]|uniref:hypothetical protein n=1 Tax=Azospirillum cavernae TaxID=2320860 RepID=UPI0018F2E5E4|nr:hypothetical protein [Azospirillum cavernae]
MTDTPKPTAPTAKPKAGNSRDDRLAARLRENLRKRKDQARQREQNDPADGGPDKT